MKSLFVILLTVLVCQAHALPEEVSHVLNLAEAKTTFQRNIEPQRLTNFKVAIHDVSFFGHKILLKDFTSGQQEQGPLGLISHHGVSVAQVYNQTIQSVLQVTNAEPLKTIKTLTKGIYLEDFKKALKDWKKNDIKIVNLSMTLRTPEIVALMNDFIDDGGIVIASSGNGAGRFGRALPKQYSSFKGLTVAASTVSGELTEFSHYDEIKSIIIPGTRDLYPVNIVKYNIAPRFEPSELSEGLSISEYTFGMTSASSPVATGLVTLALNLDQNLNQEEVNLLMKNATGLNGLVDADKFFRFVLINKEFKSFYKNNYRALMCSDNVYEFIQNLVDKNLLKENEARVVHLRKRMAPWAPINPMQGRDNQKSWSFHAFLKVENMILDFDFRDKATLIDNNSYYEQMWSKETNLLYQSLEALKYSKGHLNGTLPGELFNYSGALF